MSKVFVHHNLPYRLGALEDALVSHDRPRQGDDPLLVYCRGENTPMRPTLKILGINHNWFITTDWVYETFTENTPLVAPLTYP